MTTTTALYCRVSTADQSLARQRKRTSEYPTDRLGVEPAVIEVYSDKQTGTDTDRDGYRELMEAVESGNVERVIASEVSRISRSVRDFAAIDVGPEGYLVPNDDYETALVVLDELDKGAVSANSHAAPASRARLSNTSPLTASGMSVSRQNPAHQYLSRWLVRATSAHTVVARVSTTPMTVPSRG